MKYSVVALLFAAAVSAQTRDDIPECALGPLDKAIKSESDCEITDYVCVCKNFSAIRGAATTEILDECGTDVALNEVLPAAEALCKNPTSGGGSEEPEKESTTAAAEEPAETKPAEEESSEAPVYSLPVETTTQAPESTYNPLPPTPTTPGVSEPTVVTDGAAGLSGMGALAAIGLAVLAL